MIFPQRHYPNKVVDHFFICHKDLFNVQTAIWLSRFHNPPYCSSKMTATEVESPKARVTTHEIVPASAALSTSSKTPLPRSSKDPKPKGADAIEPPFRSETPNLYGELVDTDGNIFNVPNFTIKEIRDAIPAKCFEKSALRGFSYIFRDLLLLLTTFYAFKTYVVPSIVPSYPLRFALWSVYGFLNGLFATGLWVLAHECGHQSFSSSKILNDTVGFILHSALLVPYFSWKISHGKHHKATGHMERDMVFVPRTRPLFAEHIGVAIEKLTEITEDAPIHSALYLLGRQLFGWPIYLLTNDSGHNNHERQAEGRGAGKENGLLTGVNHFNPQSPLFEARDAKWIILSDIGLLVTGTLIYVAGQNYGWQNILVWYFLPYTWVNHWLGMSFRSFPLHFPSLVKGQ